MLYKNVVEYSMEEYFVCSLVICPGPVGAQGQAARTGACYGALTKKTNSRNVGWMD